MDPKRTPLQEPIGTTEFDRLAAQERLKAEIDAAAAAAVVEEGGFGDVQIDPLLAKHGVEKRGALASEVPSGVAPGPALQERIGTTEFDRLLEEEARERALFLERLGGGE